MTPAISKYLWARLRSVKRLISTWVRSVISWWAWWNNLALCQDEATWWANAVISGISSSTNASDWTESKPTTSSSLINGAVIDVGTLSKSASFPLSFFKPAGIIWCNMPFESRERWVLRSLIEIRKASTGSIGIVKPIALNPAIFSAVFSAWESSVIERTIRCCCLESIVKMVLEMPNPFSVSATVSKISPGVVAFDIAKEAWLNAWSKCLLRL